MEELQEPGICVYVERSLRTLLLGEEAVLAPAAAQNTALQPVLELCLVVDLQGVAGCPHATHPQITRAPGCGQLPLLHVISLGKLAWCGGVRSCPPPAPAPLDPRQGQAASKQHCCHWHYDGGGKRPS